MTIADVLSDNVSHALLGEPRRILAGIQTLLRTNPDLRPRYRHAKHVIHAFRKPAFYEITQRCNLWCEGCYYFESGERDLVREEASVGAWEGFFASEADRGVSMAYFVGAEPALHQERLIAASRWFPYGNIGTNGTVRIDAAVPYRIGVSVWAADDESDRKLRGGSAFRKAFRNYAGDPRAIILFTLSRWNLDSARTVAQMCRDNDLPLTFNMYSPTSTFLEKLGQGAANDDEFFRSSRPDDAPTFSAEDLREVRRTVAGVMDEFPETVLYSRAYNDWACQPTGLYEIDPMTGVATHCGSRIIGQMRYHSADLQRTQPKCCTPDVDCANCRMYSGGWSSKFQPSDRNVADEASFTAWLEMIDVLGRIFLYRRPTPPGAAG